MGVKGRSHTEVISFRLDDADHQKFLALVEQNNTTGTGTAGLIRKFLNENEQQERIASIENRIENIEGILSEMNKKTEDYMHDFFRFILKMDMVLHQGIAKPGRTAEELKAFYAPIFADLERQGFGDPVNLEGGA